MVAFGDVQANQPEPAWTTVPMRHVVQFLQRYLRTHWNVLRHAQIRDPAFGVLALIEKWGVDAARGAPVEKPDVRRAHGDVRVQGKS